MIDSVDSASDPAGKQYRASVTRAVNAGSFTIEQGAAATVSLASNGSGYVAQLSSVSVNGQPVAVASTSATVTSGAQNAAHNSMNAMNSVLKGFGHHVNVPSGATAVATGQRVVLPQGATLNFVLSASAAAPAAAPAAQPVAAPARPSPSPSPAMASVSANAYYTLCRFQGQQNGHAIAYVTPIILAERGASDISMAFNRYMAATYDLNKILGGSGYCRTVSNSADQRAYTMSQIEKQWADSKTVVTHIDWTGTPAEIAAANAKLAASAPAPAAPSTGGPFISCATSGGAGIDTYLTGVFQTTRSIRHLPSGGNLVDQSILDDFYAYLKQKGYSFKPGSNYGCDVSPTEAAAKAAQHKRHYEGGGCSTCGKTVETGWKE
ncbi:MAG: hypothetical protein WBF42_16690 [Terracidiphilus sp.]